MVWSKGKDNKGKGSGSSKPSVETKKTAEPKPAAANKTALDAEKLRAVSAMAEAAQKSQFAQVFSQAVGVLMRDANYRNLALKDLEFLLLPPVMAGQCVVANAKSEAGGAFVPAALALWARVSPAVDKRLSASLDGAIGLKPQEWRSGNIVWLITLAGSPRALSGLVKELSEKDFKGQQIKMRVADTSGRQSIQILNAAAAKA